MNYFETESYLKNHVSRFAEGYLMPEIRVRLAYNLKQRENRMHEMTRAFKEKKWFRHYAEDSKQFIRGMRITLLGGFINLLLSDEYRVQNDYRTFFEYAQNYLVDRKGMIPFEDQERLNSELAELERVKRVESQSTGT